MNTPHVNPLSLGLNPRQSKVAEYEGGRLLIIAGPGTGKTHTLVYRVGRTASGLGSGEKILAITFTNKAAAQLMSRLTLRIPDAPAKITVGTFHQFCLTLLREFHTAAQLPAEFAMVSPEEILKLAKEIWPELTLRERRERLEKISRWKSVEFHQPSPQEGAAYQQAMRARGWLDFDDLLLEAVRLMEGHPSVLAVIQEKYRHIFVDEYQDINAIQQRLLTLLAGQRGNVTAIGDPNQAIYGFRGSDVRFFESFSQDFPGAQILSLSDNYRCSQNILLASNQVMAKDANASMVPLTATIYTQGRLTIYAAPTDQAEAEYVVHEIEKMVGGTSLFSRDSGRVDHSTREECSFGDVAVLYRLNSQAQVLKQAFERSGIPYQISGELKSSADEENDSGDDVGPRGEIDIRYSAEKVSLMTLHAAKGLEFPVVFIVGCEENMLPLNIGSLRADPVEERRLFYVGMTRAKSALYLLRARQRMVYGQRREFSPSPFLADIEEKLKAYAEVLRKTKKKKEQLELF